MYAYPFARIDTFLDKFVYACFLSAIDLVSSYY